MVSYLLTICLLGSTPELSSKVPAAYEIEASLNDSTKVLKGNEKVRFHNPTSIPLDFIAFHLYPNAFKDTNTVFCAENSIARNRVKNGDSSKVDIQNILVNGVEIGENKYEVDGTRLYIYLDRPFPPGRTMDMEINFEIPIPALYERFGYDSDNNYLISHCFPILCGYQKDRLIDWEYHSNSEFFSNFSYYDVTLELPVGFKIVSTGVVEKESENDSTAIWQGHADTVIDFAFACGPNFEMFESNLDGIKIKCLINPKNSEFFPMVDSATKNSLTFCGDMLGEYPYETFSLADIKLDNKGMELPGLIVMGFPDRKVKMSEGMVKKTIAHEIAHQWFYGIIATNEFEEAWLDEGFASFIEYEISRKYGFDQFPMIFSNYLNSDRTVRRFFSLAQGIKYPVNLKSWDYPDWQSYSGSVYGRAWMVLQALENIMGDSTFAEALKTYSSRFRFDHPDQSDFIKTMSDVSDIDPAEFTKMFIDGTSRVDYSVESIVFDDPNVTANESVPMYKFHVNIERKLEGILPQTVTVGLEDGTEIVKRWDGEARSERMSFESNSEPVFVSIDKNVGYELDENKNNNTVYLRGNISRMISFEWDFIFTIEFWASLIL